jgi:hypothetical protein
MGWRFRRSYKILPGLRMNISSRGVSSFSFGGRGVTVNMSKRGTKTTYGLPGTGISYQTQTKPLQTATPRASAAPSVLGTPGSSAPRRSLGLYVVVSVAAVVGYLMLRPLAPAPQQVTNTEGNVPRPIAPSIPAQAPLRPFVPPAMAVDVPGRQASLPSPDRSGVWEAVTTTGANVRSMPSLSASIVRV